jgi:hypothetical protein
VASETGARSLRTAQLARSLPSSVGLEWAFLRLTCLLDMIYSGSSDMCLDFTHKPLSSTLLAIFLGCVAAMA